VLAYFEAIAHAGGLTPHVRALTEVARIDPLRADGAALAAEDFEAPHGGGPGGGAANGGGGGGGPGGGGALPAARADTIAGWRVVTRPSRWARQDEEQRQEEAQEQQQEEEAGPRPEGADGAREWRFDAVAVCVGTFSEPRLPAVEGMGSWPGRQLHCHNYRGPEAFAGQRVVVVGASFSGARGRRGARERGAAAGAGQRLAVGAHLHLPPTQTRPARLPLPHPPSQARRSRARWRARRHTSTRLPAPLRAPARRATRRRPPEAAVAPTCATRPRSSPWRRRPSRAPT
jgi:hypothetical protein